jgi:Rrf2 family iron-sulfur cluster assembly transcriptional regulator
MMRFCRTVDDQLSNLREVIGSPRLFLSFVHNPLARRAFTMRISTKGRFAVNALVDLALRAPAGRWRWPRSASVSRFRCLTWSSCSAACAAWPGGKHARPGRRLHAGAAPKNISVAEIVAAVDESLEDAAAEGQQPGRMSPRCGSAWAP